MKDAHAEHNSIELLEFERASSFVERLRVENEKWGHQARIDRWIFRGVGSSQYKLLPAAWRESSENKLSSLIAEYRPIVAAILEKMQMDGRKHGQNDSPGAIQAATNTIAQLYALGEFEGLCDEIKLYIPYGEKRDTVESYIASIRNGNPIDKCEFPHHAAAFAQHHGIPTYLLDCTYDPLTAAYFAASSYHVGHERIAVWAINLRGLVLRKIHRLILTTAPRYNFDFLHAQDAVFLRHNNGISRCIESGTWESFEDYVEERHVWLKGDTSPRNIIKLTLPHEEIPRLVTILRKYRKTEATLRPTYEHAAAQLFEDWKTISDNLRGFDYTRR